MPTKDPEKRRAKRRRKYEKHREEILTKARELWSANREDFLAKRREYLDANREGVLAQQRARYAAHPSFWVVSELRHRGIETPPPELVAALVARRKLNRLLKEIKREQ